MLGAITKEIVTGSSVLYPKCVSQILTIVGLAGPRKVSRWFKASAIQPFTSTQPQSPPADSRMGVSALHCCNFRTPSLNPPLTCTGETIHNIARSNIVRTMLDIDKVINHPHKETLTVDTDRPHGKAHLNRLLERTRNFGSGLQQ